MVSWNGSLDCMDQVVIHPGYHCQTFNLKISTQYIHPNMHTDIILWIAILKHLTTYSMHRCIANSKNINEFQVYKKEPRVNNQTIYKANKFVASFISISSAALQFALLVPPPAIPT